MATNAVKSIKANSDSSIFKDAPELPRRKSVTISGLKAIVGAVKQGGGDIKIEEDGTAEILWPITATRIATQKVEKLIRLIDDFNESVNGLELPLPVRRQLSRLDSSNPYAGIRRLYRQHSKYCPHEKKGRSHIDCRCVVWVAAFTNKEGKLIYEQSLRTRDWQQAEERRAALDAGEALDGMRRLIRRHFKSCPYKKEGVRHIDCECPVHISAYVTDDGKRVNSRSLNTRKWEIGKRRLADSEKGIPLDLIVPKGKLYRLHSPTCPHREEGRSYTKCDCQIWTERRENGKLIYRHTLGTNDWNDAEDRRATFEKSGSIAAIRTLYYLHSPTCALKLKGRTYTKCSCACPIQRDFYKKGKIVHTRSMRTRNWEEAERLLAKEVASHDADPVPSVGRPRTGVYDRWVEYGEHWPVPDDEADALAKEFHPDEF